MRAGLVRGDAHHEHHLVGILDRGEHDHGGLQPVFELVDGVAQRAGIGAVDLGGDHLHPLHVDRAGSEVHALA